MSINLREIAFTSEVYGSKLTKSDLVCMICKTCSIISFFCSLNNCMIEI